MFKPIPAAGADGGWDVLRGGADGGGWKLAANLSLKEVTILSTVLATFSIGANGVFWGF